MPREKTQNAYARSHAQAPEIADGADPAQGETAKLTECQLDVVRWLVRQALEDAEKQASPESR